MIDLSSMLLVGLLLSFAIAGKLASVTLYQIAWRNADAADLSLRGPSVVLVSRLRLWPLHLAIILVTSNASWAELEEVRWIATVLSMTIALTAVLRFGAVDQGRIYVFDRMLAIGMAVGVWVSPVMLYPSFLVSCCLQYVVAQSALSPGYSNLLGFEFLRGSACTFIAPLWAMGGLEFLGSEVEQLSKSMFTISVLLMIQASSYVNHALAKSSLGSRWYSWVLENRIQCLVVNSYLRGWYRNWSAAGVLKLASVFSRMRILCCFAAYTLEIGFAFILVDTRIAFVCLTAAICFHVTVFLLTGLAELEYVINHFALIALLYGVASSSEYEVVFGAAPTVALISFLAVNWIWVGTNRLRMFRDFERQGSSPLINWADPFDHLMAWWDSPLMRMHSYSVTTDSGQEFTFPTPKFSPYDTAITDIHTHMMILGRHASFDLLVKKDRELYPTGVWGLVVNQAVRDALYGAMDNGVQCIDAKYLDDNVKASWISDGASADEPEVNALRSFFEGLNSYLRFGWFRLVMKFPHFPGEDLVADQCPLLGSDLAEGTLANQQQIEMPADSYDFTDQVLSVQIKCVKTFYDGSSFHLLRVSDVGSIVMDKQLEESDLERQ